MNDFLTTPPDRRTPPPALRENILAAVEAETDAPPRRRWLAPLVAASVVGVVGAGALAMNREMPSPAASPDPSATSAPSTPATPAPLWQPGVRGEQLVQTCENSFPERRWVGSPLLSPSGNSVALRTATELAVCRGTANGHAAELDGLGSGVNGVRVVHDEGTGPQVVAAAGEAPKGTSDGLLAGREPVAMGNGLWIADRTLDAPGVVAQPDVMTVQFSDAQGSGGPTVWTFGWPGRPQLAALDAADTRDACTAGNGGTGSSEPAPQVVQTRQGHAVLMVSSSGAVLCTATATGASTTSTPVGSSGIYEMNALNDADSTNVAAMAGRLPDGVSRVAARTPRGLVEATISGGWWVWEDIVPRRDEGLEPEKLWLEMTGGSGHSRWVEWKNSSGDPGVSASFPKLAQGTALDGKCAKNPPDGAAGLHSAQGHVVVLTSVSGSAACTAASGFAYTSGWVAHPALDAATFGVASTSRDGGFGAALAGGVLPTGVTAVTYTTPDGPIPAVVKNGQWAFEQVLTHWDPSKLPTSVRVTGPGLDRTIQLR